MTEVVASTDAKTGQPGRSVWRLLAAACIVGVGVAYLACLYAIGLTDKNAANRDYIEYWAAGQQLAHHANPYDAAAIYQMESAAGMDLRRARVSFSPPLILYLVWPLGFFSAKNGLILWLITLLAALSLANVLIWQLNGRPDSRYHLLGYLFPPALACQMAGQITTFLLLALLLFLILQKRHPFLAGAALVPCALKPHLFLPSFAVLALWSLYGRRIRLLAGVFITLAAACLLTLAIDPQAWHQYAALMRSTGVLDAFIPTLSVGLRSVIPPHAEWIQFVPEACACVWALWYFWKNRAAWDWARHGMLLLLVSLVCTPYGWFHDDAIVLPAVLAGLYICLENRRSALPLILVAGPALIEVLAGIKLTTPWYMWTPLGWLGWYLYATARARSVSTADEPLPA